MRSVKRRPAGNSVGTAVIATGGAYCAHRPKNARSPPRHQSSTSLCPSVREARCILTVIAFDANRSGDSVTKKTFLAALLTLGAAAACVAGTAGARSTATLRGAGSSFVAPMVALWAQNYKAASIQYNAVGSGAGINAITAHQGDFGASDAPLTHDQRGACPCVQIPWALSATSVAYNIPGASPGLNITGRILADVYMGKISYWDNPKIKKLNKGKTIPHVKVTPVFRSDASGTTYNFTDYLSEVSKEFKKKVGSSTQAAFHVGIGARGSSGVASTVKQTSGGVTYVDVAYALKNHIKFFRVRNAAGKFTTPGIPSIQSAASPAKKVPPNTEM